MMKKSLFCLFSFLILNLISGSPSSDKYERFLIDFSYYEKFSGEVLGLYVVKGDVSPKISEDTYIMAEIINHYLYLKENPHANFNLPLKDKFTELITTNIFEKYANRHYNHHTELRDLQLILSNSSNEFTLNNIRSIYDSLHAFISKKEKYYSRQNNQDGMYFCDDMNKVILMPIKRIGYELGSDKSSTTDFSYRSIDSLNLQEFKLFWNDFKSSNYKSLSRYFKAITDQFIKLDTGGVIEIPFDNDNLRINKSYFVSLMMFGQVWYFELDKENYFSELHKISLIQL